MRASSLGAYRRMRRLSSRGLGACLPCDVGQSAPYFATIALNALASGLFAPFSVLYFHQVVGLSLPLVGLGLSVATGGGLLLIPLGGLLIDRLGARWSVIAANLICAVGITAYLAVHSFAEFLLVGLVVAIGASGVAIASQALVVDVAPPEQRDRWYALMRMAANAGTGSGALLAGALVAGGGTTAYRWIVLLSAISYVLAAALLLLVHAPHAAGTNHKAERSRRGAYRVVLRHHLFLSLMGSGALIWVSVFVFEIALPPYLIIVAHAPAWIVGLLFALNTGMIVVFQLPVARMIATWRRTRILAAGALIYALSFLLFAVAPLLPFNTLPLYLCACMALYTLAEIVYAPTFVTVAAALIPVGMEGRYLAVFQLFRVSAATITPALSGSLLAIAPQGLWLIVASLMFAAAGLFKALERRLPKDALRSAGVAATSPSLDEARPRACADE
jgi:MFS family permease